MENKNIKYLNHAYNSAIALGVLGLVLTGFVMVLGSTSNLLNENGINVGIASLAISLIGSALLLRRGLKVKKNRNDLVLTKSNLIWLMILSGILLFLLSGGILMLFVFIYSIVAFINVNKVLKTKKSEQTNTIK